MAISVDWPTGIITVPKADTVFASTDPISGREVRTFDTEQFHKDLRSLEESEDGRPGFPRTHDYDSETIIDGVNYAAKITMNLTYYSILFEEGTYRVVLINTNNNIAAGAVINSVSVQPTNSAGLVGSDDLRSQSFLLASVYLDTSTLNVGTVYPIGTPKRKSNNLMDSLDIAMREGLRIINQTGFIVATGTTILDNFKLVGGTGSSNVLSLSGTTTAQSDFEKLIVVGQFNGLSRIKDCILGTTGLGGVTGLEGRVVDCIINHPDGVIQKIGGAGTLFDNCSFVTPNDDQVTFNANGEGFGFRDCTGNIIITNMTKVEDLQVHIKGAIVEIDSSCTAGTLTFTGYGTIVNNTGGTVIINNLSAENSVWTAPEKDAVLSTTKLIPAAL